MNRYFYIILCACCFVISCDKSVEKPNVILIMTDDQGYGDLSVYGNPFLHTPNMDQLHNESIRLTNFHVAPVCAPTRSQLLTGIDAMHNGAYSPHGQHHLLRKDLTTMGEVFQKNGYNTALYGKWHLGGNSIGYRPHERGFDDAVYFLRGGVWSIPNHWNSDLYNDHYYHNGKLKEFKGYANDIWFNLGKDFIEKCKSNHEPFFLYLPVNAPHLPLMVSEKYREPYLNLDLDNESINFFAMIGTVDERLGDLISYLKIGGLWENTIFIFLTDNGSALRHQEFNAGLRGKKGSVYEGGHRVPFFISWPKGNLGKARDIEDLTVVQDIFPTLVDFCGLTVDNPIEFSGMSISKLLRGGRQPEVDDRIAVVQHTNRKYGGAIMYKKWRLIDRNELYDLSNDLSQEENIADQFPEIVDKLLTHYEPWWEKTTGDIPEPYFVNDREEVKLTAYDWYDGPRVFNFPHIRNGDKGYGKYRIVFTRGGKYKIAIRRWPLEADTGITESVPPYKSFDPYLGEDSYFGGDLPKGVAFDIIGARIKIGSRVQEAKVNPGDKEVVFEFDVPEGETQLQTWFIDRNGDEFGAYYVYINHSGLYNSMQASTD
jgi:arylsulfatase A-like enzyme